MVAIDITLRFASSIQTSPFMPLYFRGYGHQDQNGWSIDSGYIDSMCKFTEIERQNTPTSKDYNRARNILSRRFHLRFQLGDSSRDPLAQPKTRTKIALIPLKNLLQVNLLLYYVCYGKTAYLSSL
jgi:hypothetical protein